MLLAAAVAAQVRGRPVTEDSGPVSESSASVRDGSRPVHERGRNLRAGNAGHRLSGNPVRESVTGNTDDGTFSDLRRLPPAGGPRAPASEPQEPPILVEAVSEADLEELREVLRRIEPLPPKEPNRQPPAGE